MLQATTVSPPRRQPSHGIKLRFRVLCETTHRAYRVARDRLASPFPDRPRGVRCVSVRRSLSCTAHPLVRFAFPPEYVQPAPARKLMSGRLPWASFPHRDINRRSPRSRASQARFVPSSTFRTSSTACSSAGLAGLFHPAATSRVRSSGSFPREKPHELVARRCPRVVGAKSLPGCPGSRTSCPAFRALLLSRIRSRHAVVEAVCARYPPELRPPSGPSSRTVPATFTASSDHGLSRPSSSRPCATWLALASPPPPFEVPGLRRHHNLRCSFAARPRSPSDPLRPPNGWIVLRAAYQLWLARNVAKSHTC